MEKKSVKITFKPTGKKITLQTAIKKGLLKEDNWSDKFELPEKIVVLRKGAKSTLISIADANKLYNEKKIGRHQILGDFDITSKDNIGVVRIKDKTKALVKDKYKPNIVQKVLTQDDKLDGYVVYNFFRDNNIKELGDGKFIIIQDGQVILETNINLLSQLSLNKWWKLEGVFLGMVESDFYIWNQINYGKGTSDMGTSTFKFDRQKYNTTGAREFIFMETKPKESKKGKITKGAIKQAKKQDALNLKTHAMTKTTFVFVPDTQVNSKRISQVFRENTTNTCFFDVIEVYLNKKIDSVLNNKNYKSKLNKCKEMKRWYPCGVPQEKIQHLADLFSMNVEIYNVLGKCIQKYRSVKKPLTTIKFFNSRLDHLEQFLDYGNNVIDVESYEEMRKIVQEQTGQFYYTGTIHQPNNIYTPKGTYKFVNQQNLDINEFNKEIKIYDFAIDVVVEKDKYEYLCEGVNYNAHCAFKKLQKMTKKERKALSEDIDFCEPDMEKAYSQFEKCSEYMGFCNYMTPVLKLSDWTVDKCKKHLGYYTCNVVEIKNKNTRKILYELGIELGETYILSSPMISFLDKNGFVFDITEGSYSFKPFHIGDLPENFFHKYTDDKQFLTEQMKKDGIKGSSTYCIWAGKLNSCHLTTNYKYYGTWEDCELLASEYEDVYVNKFFNTDYETDTIINPDLQYNGMVEARIKFPNTKVNWLGHIGGYITDYTRISVMEQMLKYDHSQLYGLKLDGFILKGKFQETKGWRCKDVKANFDWGFGVFTPVFDRGCPSSAWDREDLFKHRITILAGAGGTGKSHTILDNMKDTLFTSLMWKLNVEKMNEYKIKGISWAQIIGGEGDHKCERFFTRNAIPSRILIDEITMIDKQKIYDLIEELPYTQFFLGGDIDEKGNYYQCSFKDVNVLNPNDLKHLDCGIVKFETNYRCKDDVLLEKLTSLRQYMNEVSNMPCNCKDHCWCESNKARLMQKWALFNLSDNVVQFEPSMYDYKKDWVLVSVIEGKDSQVEYYSNLLQGKKYKCIRHSVGELYKKLNGQSAYLNGEIVLDLEKESGKYKRQDAFTIHSFQGITIKEGSKMFIDLNRMFCPRQLYTALSRVEYLNQVHLIL